MSGPTVLAIETSTEACSVALWHAGALHEQFDVVPRGHADRVLPWIDRLLAEAGVARGALDAVAVGRGPGAFTGVRLGIAVAQGVAFALQRPLLPVSTLATLALAAKAPAGSRVLAAIDARMGELYVGCYVIDADGLPQPLDDEQLLRPEALVLPGDEAAQWHAIGSGMACDDACLQRHHGSRFVSCDDTALPHAADLLRIALAMHAAGGGIAAEDIEPAYLRDKVAQTLVERGKG